VTNAVAESETTAWPQHTREVGADGPAGPAATPQPTSTPSCVHQRARGVLPGMPDLENEHDDARPADPMAPGASIDDDGDAVEPNEPA
jgi:hypothetical protein